MRLRPASRADADALAQAHASAFDAPWSAADILRFAEDPGGFALAVETGAGLAGFILCRVVAGEAEVLTLAVRPEHRRRGVARDLVEAAAALAARTAGAMFLEVAEDNAAALALYAQTAFSRAGRRPGYYARPGAPAVDAIVMRRTLNS
ncbi:MAG TPA: GNAT family N-acetyltransferase [Caulobacteraceae bacterium]|nr:GNAT family N-acetyltransferase [Caulobacteraceae bacterium]